MIEGYLTANEVAEKLGVTPGRVRQLIAEKRLKAVKVGRDNLITLEDVENFERQAVGRPPKTKEENEK